MKKAAGGVLIACAVSLILVLCLQASGAIVIFSSRDAWESANRGDIDYFHNFSAHNFQVIGPEVSKNIAFPGFSILQDPGFAINFNGTADLFASRSNPLLLTFDNPLFGFAADIVVLDGTLELRTSSSEDPVSIPSGTRTTTFFGMLSDQRFNAINFSSAVLDLQLDSIGRASEPTVHFQLNNVSLAQVVPEPASLIIWGAGMLTAMGYVAIRRRGRQQQCARV